MNVCALVCVKSEETTRLFTTLIERGVKTKTLYIKITNHSFWLLCTRLEITVPVGEALNTNN